jgi:hypothetical protein
VEDGGSREREDRRKEFSFAFIRVHWRPFAVHNARSDCSDGLQKVATRGEHPDRGFG